MNVYSLRSFCLAVAPINCHYITPPPLFAPVPCPHGEIPFLPLRFGIAFANISSNVEFEGWGSGAVKLNHDMGYLIIHVPYGPVTPILAVHIAFSKCKTVFGKATVKINGEQAGWYLPLIAPFLICSDPIGAAPLGQNVSFIWTTVKFGFSWGDFLCGWIRTIDPIQVAGADGLPVDGFIWNPLRTANDWARTHSLLPYISPLGLSRMAMGAKPDWTSSPAFNTRSPVQPPASTTITSDLTGGRPVSRNVPNRSSQAWRKAYAATARIQRAISATSARRERGCAIGDYLSASNRPAARNCW
jgi:hypothetical protein